MSGEVFVQFGVILNVLLVLHDVGVLVHILRYAVVLVQKLSEIGRVLTTRVVLAVFDTVKALFVLHEGNRVRLYLLADCRVLLQEAFERRMALDELLVIEQRRILAELLGDFLVTV